MPTIQVPPVDPAAFASMQVALAAVRDPSPEQLDKMLSISPEYLTGRPSSGVPRVSGQPPAYVLDGVDWRDRLLCPPWIRSLRLPDRPAPQGTEVDPDILLSIVEARRNFEPFEPGRFEGQGIVTCAGRGVYQANAYVLFRLLRHLGCTLPVECWHVGADEEDPAFAELVAPLGVECRCGVDQGFRAWGLPAEETTLRFKGAARYTPQMIDGYGLKPFAILHSQFREVVFIDADNDPQRDPSFLFDCDEYREFGLMLWPDRGNNRTPGHHGAYLPAFGLPDRVCEGIETGQQVFDKRRTWEVLLLAAWFAGWPDYFFQFSWGDKDLAHAAALWCLCPFFVGPPVLPGEYSTMIQRAPDGKPLFFHRCSPRPKWPVEGEPVRISGFRWHRECLAFLDEWRSWNRARADALQPE